MTYKPWFPTQKPLPKSATVVEPVVRSEPPRPTGKPAWLGEAESPEAYLYAQAVRKAFAPPRPEPEPDPFYDWLYGTGE